MEFLVEFDVRVPEGTPEAEIEQRVSDEAAASADVTLVRLWKPPTGANVRSCR
jgi:muconolactone delta-isomerase